MPYCTALTDLFIILLIPTTTLILILTGLFILACLLHFVLLGLSLGLSLGLGLGIGHGLCLLLCLLHLRGGLG
ncbi:hypothetical protein V8E51_004400 [Hyaloscypha variabilis]